MIKSPITKAVVIGVPTAFVDVPNPFFAEIEKKAADLIKLTEIKKEAKTNSIIIPMIRRAIPNMIAHDFIGVQPMQAPAIEIFLMRK